jgi:hypothetical protein
MAHLDRARTLLTAATKSESYGEQVASYRNLFGVHCSLCSHLLTMVAFLVTSGVEVTLATTSKKRNEKLTVLWTMVRRLPATISTTSIQKAVRTARTGAKSPLPPNWATMTSKQRQQHDWKQMAELYPHYLNPLDGTGKL